MSIIDDIFEVCRQLDIQDANEAETRLKVIDKIIFDVLGWTHEDITVEDRVSEENRSYL